MTASLISDFDRGFLVATIETEGTISVVRHTQGHIYPYVRVNNTAKDLVDFLASLLDRAGIRYSRYSWTEKKHPHRKRMYGIWVDSQKQLRLLIPLLQGLPSKQRELEMLSQFIESRMNRKNPTIESRDGKGRILQSNGGGYSDTDFEIVSWFRGLNRKGRHRK